MRPNKVNFHISPQAGLELVFTSGQALAYPLHTHVSSFTYTVVRRGFVQLKRSGSLEFHPCGSMYRVAPHEPHSPAYSDNFEIVSLCLDKTRFARAPGLSSQFMALANGFVANGFLSAADARALAQGIEAEPGISFEPELPSRDQARNAFSFIRRFKEKTGLTPHQYTIQNRIRTAKKLLAAGTPIAETALQSGFYDQSHLNRWFIRALGLTPQAYQNSCFFLDAG